MFALFSGINLANVYQGNTQLGANVALGSLVGAQALVQMAGNSASVTQG